MFMNNSCNFLLKYQKQKFITKENVFLSKILEE